MARSKDEFIQLQRNRDWAAQFGTAQQAKRAEMELETAFAELDREASAARLAGAVRSAGAFVPGGPRGPYKKAPK